MLHFCAFHVIRSEKSIPRHETLENVSPQRCSRHWRRILSLKITDTSIHYWCTNCWAHRRPIPKLVPIRSQLLDAPIFLWYGYWNISCITQHWTKACFSRWICWAGWSNRARTNELCFSLFMFAFALPIIVTSRLCMHVHHVEFPLRFPLRSLSRWSHWNRCIRCPLLQSTLTSLHQLQKELRNVSVGDGCIAIEREASTKGLKEAVREGSSIKVLRGIVCIISPVDNWKNLHSQISAKHGKHGTAFGAYFCLWNRMQFLGFKKRSVAFSIAVGSFEVSRVLLRDEPSQTHSRIHTCFRPDHEAGIRWSLETWLTQRLLSARLISAPSPFIPQGCGRFLFFTSFTPVVNNPVKRAVFNNPSSADYNPLIDGGVRLHANEREAHI